MRPTELTVWIAGALHHGTPVVCIRDISDGKMLILSVNNHLPEGARGDISRQYEFIANLLKEELVEATRFYPHVHPHHLVQAILHSGGQGCVRFLVLDKETKRIEACGGLSPNEGEDWATLFAVRREDTRHLPTMAFKITKMLIEAARQSGKYTSLQNMIAPENELSCRMLKHLGAEFIDLNNKYRWFIIPLKQD